MTSAAATEATFEIVCPHCKKAFAAPLLSGAAERYRGFKCPHCRLFVPRERVEDEPIVPEVVP